MSISDAPRHVQQTYFLMCKHLTAREIAGVMGVTLKTACNYRNRVNRIVGFRRPWEPGSAVRAQETSTLSLSK